MENQNLQQLRVVLDVFDRYKLLIVVYGFLGISMGLVFYLLQPKIYESSALLSFQQQEINPDKQSSFVGSKFNDMVSTTSQIVKSRGNLEKIILDQQLYLKERQKFPMEDIVELMRRNIRIITSREGDTFTITFMGADPRKVVRITNALSSKFIEENLKYRQERASEVSDYTQDELDMTKKMLDEKEAVMRDYKLEHYNEMPEQRATNISRMIALQQQYQKVQSSIQELDRTKVLIREQLVTYQKQTKEKQQPVDLSSVKNLTSEEIVEIEVENARKSLELLKQRYTADHPKIKKLKKKIKEYEQNVQNAGTASGGKKKKGFNQVLFDLELQLKGINLDIKELQEEKKSLSKSVEQHRKWIEAAPVCEAEWTALTREYEQFKRRYDFLVAQNLQARSALNLERKQKGSQFKIEDPARRPTKPIKPSFKKVMAVAILGGFGLGGCFAMMLNFLNLTFRDPDHLEEITNIEVICTVPQLKLEHEVRKEKNVMRFKAFILICWAGLIVGAIVYFGRIGRIVF